jgi:hypothetical protein
VSDFTQRLSQELANPNVWDFADAGATSLEEYWKVLGAAYARAAKGLVDIAEDAQQIAKSYNVYLRALELVNARMGSEFPALTGDDLATYRAMRQAEDSLRYAHARLAASVNANVSIAELKREVARFAPQAGRALGVFVGVGEILAVANSGSYDDVGKTTVGVFVGAGIGFALGNAAWVTAIAATGPIGWIGAAVVIAMGSYMGSQAAEVAWENVISSDGERLRRELIEQAESLFGRDDPITTGVRQQLQHGADKLGALNGTWLQGFTELSSTEKAQLTYLMLAPGGARPTAGFMVDLAKVFDLAWSAEQLKLRDGLIRMLGAITREPSLLSSQKYRRHSAP